MSFKELSITHSAVLPEVMVIKPSVYSDLRGNIYTSFNRELYRGLLPDGIDFIHDKFAESRFNVLRGLHGDTKTWKLVSCVFGELYEVVADVRRGSPTFGKWDAFLLRGDDYIQILIPPGYVNGYYVKSDKAVFHYKLAYTGDYVDASDQMTIFWNDPDLAIEWPCSAPILQERDMKPKN
ncbi:MAG: dTDP-4-dehydrorhamnose 3,5-epimerase family protein [Bacteroidales bacterium]|nr:dTDP-4-dehydrorhamnose 3,5-epimerase family protein [Bacteroidales bacterium]